jgi:DHA2 family multidrug resistance protein-like MFS transporter
VDQKTVQARRWYILGVLVVCLLIVILDNTILNVALKTIQQDLNASQSDMEWAINAYVLVFAGLLFTFGVLGDRYGRKRVLMIGMLLFGAMSALTAFAQTSGQLIACRALMGIGGAMVQPQTLSIITNVFEPRERGRAIGIWAGFSGLAVAIGPVTGGFLLEHFWWGSVFLINIPVAIVGLIGLAALVPDSKDPQPGRIDPIGVVLSIAGLVLFIYGIIKGGQTTDWGSPQVWGTMVGGLTLLAAFVLVERRSTHPSLDISLFRNPAFSAATGAIGFAFLGLMGSTFYLAYYLQLGRGYSPLRAGLCLIAVAIPLMFAAARSGKMAQRYGPRLVASTGLLLVTIAYVGYVVVDQNTPLWVVEALLALMGLGMGNVMAPATNVVMGAVPRAKAGSGAAVNNTIRQVGGALGVAILGSVLAASYRGHFGSTGDALPAPVRGGDVAESIGGTFAAIGRTVAGVASGRFPRQTLGAIPGVQRASIDSFMSAMHVTSLAAAGFTLVGAIVVALFLPGRQAMHERGAAEQERVETAAAVGH